MATKKSKKVAALVKVNGETQLDTAALSNVVVETRLTKMEMAEYLSTLAYQELDATYKRLAAEEQALTQVELADSDLTPRQRWARDAYRLLYGEAHVYLYLPSETVSVRADTQPSAIGRQWDLPTTELQKNHPAHEKRKKASEARQAAFARLQAFRPEHAKIKVIEAMLGGSEEGRNVLNQLKGMVNRAVRGE